MEPRWYNMGAVFWVQRACSSWTIPRASRYRWLENTAEENLSSEDQGHDEPEFVAYCHTKGASGQEPTDWPCQMCVEVQDLIGIDEVETSSRGRVSHERRGKALKKLFEKGNLFPFSLYRTFDIQMRNDHPEDKPMDEDPDPQDPGRGRSPDHPPRRRRSRSASPQARRSDHARAPRGDAEVGLQPAQLVHLAPHQLRHLLWVWCSLQRSGPHGWPLFQSLRW